MYCTLYSNYNMVQTSTFLKGINVPRKEYVLITNSIYSYLIFHVIPIKFWEYNQKKCTTCVRRLMNFYCNNFNFYIFRVLAIYSAL